MNAKKKKKNEWQGQTEGRREEGKKEMERVVSTISDDKDFRQESGIVVSLLLNI